MPDVAIVDIRMPPTHTDEGLRAAHEIRERHPEMGIVILSQHVEVGMAMQLLAESPEGLGYLLKDRVTDVDDVRRRRCAASPPAARRSTREVVAAAARQRARRRPAATPHPREREVLELIAEGRSNQGDRRAAGDHRARRAEARDELFAKLGLPAGDDDHRRVLAVLAFLRA